MIATVQKTTEERALLPDHARVVLAVSGGGDSMAMLHAVASLASLRDDLLLRVAHVHHGLRGRAADADARLVRDAARALGLPFHLHRGDARAVAKSRKISVEMAAREIRHAFFRRLVKKYDAVIATAHTRDDQAETVVMRWVRGSGTDGLAGMDYVTELRGFRVIRPLLDVSHAEAIAFLRARKIAWREDASNADARMVRNRIRHTLLPLLEKEFNPRIREVIARTASVVRTDAACLARLADRAFARRCKDGALRLGGAMEAAIRRRIVYRWLLREAGVAADRLDNELVCRVEQLAKEGGALTLPGAILVQARRGVLSVEARA